MPFDILGPIGAIQSGQSTLEFGNVGVSNCVYLCLKGDEQVVPCLIFTPEELDSLLAMVDLACSEQERLEQGSVVRLGVMHPKPITLRVALIHPHNAKPVLLLRFYQGQWKSDVMAPPKDVAMLLRQGKVDGPAPLNGTLKKIDASTWQLDEKKLLLLEGLSAGYGPSGQYVHPEEVEDGESLQVWTYQQDGQEFVAAFRLAGSSEEQSEGGRADSLLFRGETHLARRAYRQLAGIPKCPKDWLARATLGTLVAMVLEGDDQTGHQIWLGRSLEKWQQVGLNALESGELKGRDHLLFQQVAAYYHSMNPDAAQASKAVQGLMADVYRQSRGLDNSFRRAVLSNWYLFLKEIYEAQPPEQALVKWSECVRDFGGVVKPKALWFPRPAEWPSGVEKAVAGPAMPQIPSLGENPVLVQFLKGVAVFCGVLVMLYLASSLFSSKKGRPAVRVAGPGRVTLNGVGVDLDREELLAEGWRADGRINGNLRKGDVSARFNKNNQLIEVWGKELMLDGKVIARSGQSRSEIFEVLGEPNKRLENKRIYYYVFDDGGQRKALQVDASMDSEDVGISLLPADDSFQEVKDIDLIEQLTVR